MADERDERIVVESALPMLIGEDPIGESLRLALFLVQALPVAHLVWLLYWISGKLTALDPEKAERQKHHHEVLLERFGNIVARSPSPVEDRLVLTSRIAYEIGYAIEQIERAHAGLPALPQEEASRALIQKVENAMAEVSAETQANAAAEKAATQAAQTIPTTGYPIYTRGPWQA